MNNPFEVILSKLNVIENSISEIKSHKTLPLIVTNESLPITIERVCEITKLAKQTIYGLCNSKKMKHYKNGNKLYFFENDIINYIKKGERKTISEIHEETRKNLKKINTKK